MSVESGNDIGISMERGTISEYGCGSSSNRSIAFRSGTVSGIRLPQTLSVIVDIQSLSDLYAQSARTRASMQSTEESEREHTSRELRDEKAARDAVEQGNNTPATSSSPSETRSLFCRNICYFRSGS